MIIGKTEIGPSGEPSNDGKSFGIVKKTFGVHHNPQSEALENLGEDVAAGRLTEKQAVEMVLGMSED